MLPVTLTLTLTLTLLIVMLCLCVCVHIDVLAGRLAGWSTDGWTDGPDGWTGGRTCVMCVGPVYVMDVGVSLRLCDVVIDCKYVVCWLC